MSILNLFRKARTTGSTKPAPTVEEPKNIRRHRTACLTAYHAKGQLVKAGKGHNTLSGIPASLLS